jgi:hypothetical protein
MNAPLSPRETKDILLREYDRQAAALDASVARVAASISDASGSDRQKTEALLTDALIERGDIVPACPDFIPAWLEAEGAS